MMKIYYLKLWSLILISTFFSTVALAQPRVPTTIIVKTGNPDLNEIKACEEAFFSVQVANLELLGGETITMGTGIEETVYLLPETVPDMYLELSVGSLHYSITELVYFQFSHVKDGVNIYEAGILVDLPGNYNATWEARILMQGSGGPHDVGSLPAGYSFYPMWEHRSSGDLFPCEVGGNFSDVYWSDCRAECEENTEDDCHSIGIYAGIVYCEGGEIGSGFGLIQNTPNEYIPEYEFQSDENFTTPDISPNPFESDIRLSFIAEKEGSLNIQLMNIQGQVIQQWQKQINKGSNNIEVSTNDIPAGVYFLRVSNAGQEFTEKLIKY